MKTTEKKMLEILNATLKTVNSILAENGNDKGAQIFIAQFGAQQYLIEELTNKRVNLVGSGKDMTAILV